MPEAVARSSPRAPSVCRAGAFPAHRPSFDSLLFWGIRERTGNAACYRNAFSCAEILRAWKRCPLPSVGRAGRAWNVPAYRAGAATSVLSVSCRTRSRRPTPARPAPGRRVKGKISRQGGVERGLCFIRRPSSEKVWLNAGCFLFVLELPCINAGTGLCLRRIALSSTHCPASACKEHSRLHAASVCKGQPCINAPFSLSFANVGRITTLRGPRTPSSVRAAGHK